MKLVTCSLYSLQTTSLLIFCLLQAWSLTRPCWVLTSTCAVQCWRWLEETVPAGKILELRSCDFNLSLSPLSCSNYNIYEDPAPSENSRALKVLQDLLCKVEEFLLEWPEHPTLVQVTASPHVIYLASFPALPLPLLL